MIRPVEPGDAPAVHALCTRPAVARWSGDHPWLPAVVIERRLAADAHRLGRWEGDRLVAMAALTPSPAARARHSASIATHGDDPELLIALLEVADRWLGLVRVEIEVDVQDPAIPSLREAGFVSEVHKRCARHRDGLRVDTWLMGRISPLWSPTNHALRPPPKWPAPSGDRAAVTIRPTTPADGPAFAALHRDPSVVWGTLQLPTITGAGWAARLQKNDRAETVSLCAEIGGAIVGSAGVWSAPHPSRHVAHLGMSVGSAWQGRGVGRALLEAALEAAESWLGATRVELEVFVTNTRAMGLYRSAGFESEGIRRYMGWQDGDLADSVVMARVKG